MLVAYTDQEEWSYKQNTVLKCKYSSGTFYSKDYSVCLNKVYSHRHFRCLTITNGCVHRQLQKHGRIVVLFALLPGVHLENALHMCRCILQHLLMQRRCRHTKKRRYMDIHTDSTCKPFNDKIYIKNAKIHQCTDPSSQKNEGIQSSPEVFLKHD